MKRRLKKVPGPRREFSEMFAEAAVARDVALRGLQPQSAIVFVQGAESKISFQYMRREGTEYAFTATESDASRLLDWFLEWRSRTGGRILDPSGATARRFSNSRSMSREMLLEPWGDLVIMPPHSEFLVHFSAGVEPWVNDTGAAPLSVGQAEAVFLFDAGGDPMFVWGH